MYKEFDMRGVGKKSPLAKFGYGGKTERSESGCCVGCQ